MLDDFLVVTLTRPGPLHVRLKPDSRGLVILNNFDPLPDDPHTSCPRLGPIEGVGNVMPGDALVSCPLDLLDVFSTRLRMFDSDAVPCVLPKKIKWVLCR